MSKIVYIYIYILLWWIFSIVIWQLIHWSCRCHAPQVGPVTKDKAEPHMIMWCHPVFCDMVSELTFMPWTVDSWITSYAHDHGLPSWDHNMQHQAWCHDYDARSRTFHHTVVTHAWYVHAIANRCHEPHTHTVDSSEAPAYITNCVNHTVLCRFIYWDLSLGSLHVATLPLSRPWSIFVAHGTERRLANARVLVNTNVTSQCHWYQPVCLPYSAVVLS